MLKHDRKLSNFVYFKHKITLSYFFRESFTKKLKNTCLSFYFFPNIRTYGNKAQFGQNIRILVSKQATDGAGKDKARRNQFAVI